MPWSEFSQLEEWYSLPRARVVHGLARGVAKLLDHEPDASSKGYKGSPRYKV